MLPVGNSYLRERLKIWPVCQILSAVPQMQYF